mmetsp:Transcript_2224/g.4700  ORF Transcript_2224/g.4700 Transcript_2224/m.4700 type:complete len:89 (+) Transcript_2224:203-469(+)
MERSSKPSAKAGDTVTNKEPMIVAMDVSSTALREADSFVVDKVLVTVGGHTNVNASINGLASDREVATRKRNLRSMFDLYTPSVGNKF